MTVIDVDEPENMIVFTSPMRGGEINGQLPIQALGSEETYQRRYLYLAALDIAEQDGIDEGAGSTTGGEKAPASKPAAKIIPPTTQDRAEIKVALADANGNASELQIKQLKAALRKLIEADASYGPMVDQIGIDTEGLTKITKAECEGLLVKISDILARKE